jgi:hypothetical protein
MCGKITEFPSGHNPNARGDICPRCSVALGSWNPA